MNVNDLLIRPGSTVRLAEIDPRDTGEYGEKNEAREKLERDLEKLARLQDVFAAAASEAMLVVFQGMDSAGKDGAIKHVMSGINP